MTEAQGSEGQASGAAAAAAVTGQPGIPGAANGAGAADKGSGGNGAADPFAGLDTGIREWVGTAGFKFDDPKALVEGLANKARSAESLIGKSVQLPDADAKPEDWDAFNKSVVSKLPADRRPPETADGYEFKLPDSVPKEMPYDADFAKAFKAIAHDAGLAPAKAQVVHDFYVGKAADFFKAQHEKTAERINTATTALEKEWGPPDGDKHKDASDMSLRALKGLGVESAFQDAGLLGPNNLVLDAGIALALEKVGRAMFREDSLVTGDAGGAVDNPFKEGFGKGNQTAQYQAIKQDRAAAIRMIRQAGHDPKAWNLTEG